MLIQFLINSHLGHCCSLLWYSYLWPSPQLCGLCFIFLGLIFGDKSVHVTPLCLDLFMWHSGPFPVKQVLPFQFCLCFFPLMASLLQIFFCKCSICLPLCGFAHTILSVWKVVIPVHPLIPNIINVASSLKSFSPQTHCGHFLQCAKCFICVYCVFHMRSQSSSG